MANYVNNKWVFQNDIQFDTEDFPNGFCVESTMYCNGEFWDKFVVQPGFGTIKCFRGNFDTQTELTIYADNALQDSCKTIYFLCEMPNINSSYHKLGSEMNLSDWFNYNGSTGTPNAITPDKRTRIINATYLESSLEALSEAIRNKTHNAGSLSFPIGFLKEVQKISEETINSAPVISAPRTEETSIKAELKEETIVEESVANVPTQSYNIWFGMSSPDDISKLWVKIKPTENICIRDSDINEGEQLEDGQLLIVTSPTGKQVCLLQNNNTNITLGIDKIYIGSTKNGTHEIKGYANTDGKWKKLN